MRRINSSVSGRVESLRFFGFLLATLLAAGAQAEVTVESTVSALPGGLFHYDFAITNGLAEDVAIVIVGAAPLQDADIQTTIAAPVDFFASYDGSVGIVDFAEADEIFSAGVTVGGFGFDTSTGPATGFFSTFRALTASGNLEQGTVNFVPEPSLPLLVLAGVVGIAIGSRRRRSAAPQPLRRERLLPIEWTSSMKGLDRCVRLATVLSIAHAFAAGAAWSADHRDGSITQDQPADIADTYAFVNPADPSRLVLGLSVNPNLPAGVTASFSTDLLYQIKIDNDGDFVEDLVIQAVYDGLGSDQKFLVTGPLPPTRTGPISDLHTGVAPITGLADGSVQTSTPGNVRVFAGRTDDPFFIDQIFLRAFLDDPEVPSLQILSTAGRAPGFDTSAGSNVSSLMVEVPASTIRSATGDDLIHVWSTVSRRRIGLQRLAGAAATTGPWIQVERGGMPLINRHLVPPERRDDFNRWGTPAGDAAEFGDDIAMYLAEKPNLASFNGRDPQFYHEQVLPLVLPAVLRLDLTSTSSGLELIGGGGVPVMSFNGHAPSDDFGDLFLFLLSDGAAADDGVSANDCTPQVPDLRTGQDLHPNELTCEATSGLDNGLPVVFPFLGAEHQPRESVPARDGPPIEPPN